MIRTGLNVGNTRKGERAVEKFTRKAGILAAAAAFVGISVQTQAQDLLYDWKAVDQASTPVVGFTPAPFVTDANAASPALLSQLQQLQASNPGRVAIKVPSGTGLSPASIATLFNNPNFTINYAFLDIETPVTSGGNSNTAVAQTNANLIHAQPKGTGTFVGNYRLFPGNGDTSGPGAGPTITDYRSGGATGVNMANEDLYPGSPTYRAGNTVPGSPSTEIRRGLFVLPIERASYVSNNLPAGNKHIPYVNRFNNFNNPALQNGTTGGFPSFTPGVAAGGFTGAQTANNMLSRGDFSALVAHYRLRGADGVHLLDGGVVGYTQAQFEQDAKDGFQQPAIAAIFNGGGAKLATLDTVSKVDGSVQDNEATGVVYSGVYSLTQGSGKLALLVSNLDDGLHTLEIPQAIGGKFVPGSISIAGGQHKLLEFTGAGTQWQLNAGSGLAVFTDSDRSGVGVPEPVAMGGASVFALTMLFRRRRSR